MVDQLLKKILKTGIPLNQRDRYMMVNVSSRQYTIEIKI